MIEEAGAPPGGMCNGDVPRPGVLSHPNFPPGFFPNIPPEYPARISRVLPGAILGAPPTAGAGMRTQRFFITWQAVALFTLGVAAVHPQELRTGAAIERRIKGGESHSYPIEARAGVRLLVTVDQRGIDVVVEARQPDGKTLIAVDSPTDSRGPESALLPEKAFGPLEIRVLAPSPGVAPGAYEIRLEEL